MIKSTCGLFIFNNDKLLICHPTGSRWNQWSIPKGMKEDNETTLHAAIRETVEETALVVSPTNSFIELPTQIYKNKSKKLISFYVKIEEDLSNFKFRCDSMTSQNYPEIDNWKWISPISLEAKFLHPTQITVLNLIKENILKNNF